MQTEKEYVASAGKQFYIDKTGCLEKGIAAFPSIYIEGAAASGKTTAVRMLLAAHPEVNAVIFFMDKEYGSFQYESFQYESFQNKLEELLGRMRKDTLWAVFENLTEGIPREAAEALKDFVLRMPGHCRAVLVGRESPPVGLLELVWKRQMELIPQETLLFSREEVRELAAKTDAGIAPDDIYAQTGGWAGCVDMMLRLSERGDKRSVSAEELRRSYELDAYIKAEILDTLSQREQRVMVRAAACPWVSVAMCEELWELEDGEALLKRLERKGMLAFEKKKGRWKIAPLFQYYHQSPYFRQLLEEDGRQQIIRDFWEKSGEWYEKAGYIREALICLKQSENAERYRESILRHYNRIPFLDLPYAEVMDWNERTPEICYLRGMYCYGRQNMEGLRRELHSMERLKDAGHLQQEVYLNLLYVNPEISLEQWLEELDSSGSGQQRLRLYDILGNSLSFLCGLRDLTALFACPRKEENRRARIWKERLGEKEWKCYRLARLDYYLETERRDAIDEEDWNLLMQEREEEDWQFMLVKMYLFGRLQRMRQDEENIERILRLKQRLLWTEHPACVRLTEALGNLFSPWCREREKLFSWLRYAVMDSTVSLDEGNFVMFCCRAKGYLFLNQYERAEKILNKAIPYAQYYHRSRLLAELLFEEAIIKWGADLHSQAVRYAVESFLVTGMGRYVGFYMGYGEKGRVVLEAYANWMRSSMPEGWHRKKKYNYGSVLRMPMPDYIEFILRCAKRKGSAQQQPFPDEYVEERLTMMETIILQDIGRGLTNAEICEELGVKLPTVKSHIYSLYKKLGINSRVQAVIKGKELGIIE